MVIATYSLFVCGAQSQPCSHSRDNPVAAMFMVPRFRWNIPSAFGMPRGYVRPPPSSRRRGWHPAGSYIEHGIERPKFPGVVMIRGPEARTAHRSRRRRSAPVPALHLMRPVGQCRSAGGHAFRQPCSGSGNVPDQPVCGVDEALARVRFGIVHQHQKTLCSRRNLLPFQGWRHSCGLRGAAVFNGHPGSSHRQIHLR